MRTVQVSYVRFLFVSVALLSAAVTTDAQPIDVAWTFGNVGSSSYRLDAFDPSDIAFGTVGSQDPTLPLELGKRYQVTVTQPSVHPLEIIAKAPSAPSDVVLLSMSVNAPFESDPDVNWVDDGQGTVAFTLTTPLYQAMLEGNRVPGYRCRPHLFQMRGDFTVTGGPVDKRITPSAIRVDVQTVASGLAAPLQLVSDPETPDRFLVVDQSGLIRVIEQGQLLDEPLLDVRDRLVQLGIFGDFDANDYDERGLLGFALHPNFAESDRPGFHKFYTYTSEPVSGPADFTVDVGDAEMNHQSVITEWGFARGQNRVEPASARVVMRIDQPQFNHNGGMLAFGHDGYLYIGLGDGGGANDSAPGHGDSGNGQNIQTVHGSILRIDPLAPEETLGSRDPVSANGAYRVPWDNPFVGVDGVDEIYAYGFRNPFAFSFDRLSGVPIVADVGQDYVEEIDLVHKGLNYGWNLKEGDFLFNPGSDLVGLPFEDPSLTDPVAQYDHEDGLSVIGGHMYYGQAIPKLRALYVFGDFSTAFDAPAGRLFVADLFTGDIHELLIGEDQEPLGLFVKGISADADGEIYILASTALGPYGETGVVLKLVPSGSGS